MDILNIIGLLIALVVIIVIFIQWLRAEYKLSKHNESTIFTNKEKNKKGE